MPVDPNQKALAVLQNAAGAFAGGTPEEQDAIEHAALEVATYHSPVSNQATRHHYLAAALRDFLVVIVRNCPPGADRSRAISAAREAKMWASAAVALENS